MARVGARRASASLDRDMGTLLLVALVVAAAAFLLDIVQSAISDGRSAARSALRREHEEHLIDDEAFARGLRAIDEAA